MKNRRAVIVGSRGQDGTLLDARLRELGYSVLGLTRDAIDITNYSQVKQLLADESAAELYFLAAHHHASQAVPRVGLGELFWRSIDVHLVAAINILEAIATVSPQTRMFYASSSLIYTPSELSQTESTVANPEEPYGITKMAGMMACRHYRASKGLFVSIGILFNHESMLRKEIFLSRKIVRAAVKIKLGLSETLELGDLEAKVDWGYAPDYVDAMHRILQLDIPDDFVIATGELHTVREFVELAFGCLGLDYRRYLTVKPDTVGRVNSARLGDATKLRTLCGWRPTRTFKGMVEELANRELAASTIAERDSNAQLRLSQSVQDGK